MGAGDWPAAVAGRPIVVVCAGDWPVAVVAGRPTVAARLPAVVVSQC